MMELGVNILASYLVWLAVTTIFRDRIKSGIAYVSFPFTLYSLPCLYHALAESDVVGLISVFVSAAMLLYLSVKGRNVNTLVTILIPLPQVVTLVCETVV